MTRQHTWRETDAGRTGPLARLPLFFSLQGKRAVIAGGSAAAAWKAELLSAAGAAVDVYSVEESEPMAKLAARPPGGNIGVHRRMWTAADLPGAAVVIGAFDDARGAAAFCHAARAAGVPVNVVDRPAFCDFSFGAIVNRSPLVIGISTDGAAPVFAQAIRGKLEALLPMGFAIWTAAAARWRDAIKQSGLSRAGRRKFWELFVAHALTRPDRPPRQRDFDRFIADADTGGGTERGSVVRIAVDPDNPDLLTLRDIRALHAADVIIFDDRVPHEALDFARREARKIAFGDASDDGVHGWRDIAGLSADFAREGQRVVLVTSLRRTDRALVQLFSAA
jgi:uroporphyrin-III C-methyltransferase/precorrin-2 dehydrogenase/sirohydrochlorin ferrochelatase